MYKNLKNFFFVVFAIAVVSCSGSQKKTVLQESREYQGDDAVTLRIKPELSINVFDGEDVQWPAVGKDFVKVAPGTHSFECSYHVTVTTEDATTQKSARGLLFKSAVEAGKTYLLDYKLTETNIELSLTPQEKDSNKKEAEEENSSNPKEDAQKKTSSPS